MQKGEKSLGYEIFLVIATIIIIISAGVFLVINTVYPQVSDTTTPVPNQSSTLHLADFGIKADGSDETAQLQSALNHAKSNGYTAVSFPTGGKTIGISDPIYIPATMEIMGNECTIKLLAMSGIGHWVWTIDTGPGVYIHNLKINGNMDNQEASSDPDYYFPKAPNDGIALRDGARFEYNEVYNFGGYSVGAVRGDNITISNNRIHDSWQYGISTSGEGEDYGKNITITKNTFSNCGQVGIKLRGCAYCLVSENSITLPDSEGDPTGIRLYSLDEPNMHISIMNNTITGSGSGTDIAIDSDNENNSDIAITGNKIKTVHTGIRIRFDDATVSDNTIQDSRFTGILLYGSSGTVLHNLLKNAGIIIAGGNSSEKYPSHNLIQDNVITGGNQYWRAKGTGIYVWYTTKGNIIDGNEIHVDNNAIKITNDYGESSGYIIKNNILYSKTDWISDKGRSTEISNNTQLLPPGIITQFWNLLSPSPGNSSKY
jgi:parallel beta-helix repeat protein